MRRILAVAILLLAGCSAQTITPGTANVFDSDTYRTLATVDSVIQSTKSALAANQFPASIAGNVKTALNALISAYDVADTFYCGQPLGNPPVCSTGSYHALAIAGTVTPAQTAQMQANLTSVNTATTNLTSAKGN